MAVNIVTDAQHALMQSPGQWSRFFLSIEEPVAVYSAQLGTPPSTTDKVVVIGYINGVGVLAHVLPGMSLYVGTTPGAYDRGMARIRKNPDANYFYIGEISEIDWHAGDYLTVVDEFGLWPKHIREVSNVPYVDYDIPYSNQHTNFAPLVVGGPDPVVWLNGLSVDVPFDVTRSWVIGNAAITYSWSAPGSTSVTGGSTATPTIAYGTEGRYLVTCSATANGKTTNRVWTVQVYGPHRQPATQFEIKQLEYSETGMGFQVTMYDPSEAGFSVVRNRAKVVLFSQSYYGDQQVDMGTVAGRENIEAWGWINGETINYSPELSTVTFEVQAVGFWLQQMPGFPAGFESQTRQADAWTNFRNMILDMALFSTIYYRTTIPQCLDFLVTGDTKLIEELPSPGSTSIWEQINTFAYQSLLAKPIPDILGALYIMVDANLTPKASRSGIPVVMSLTKADMQKELTIQRSPVPKCALVDLSGAVFNGSTNTSIFSLAFGQTYGHFGTVMTVDRLALASQAQSNELAGLVMGQQNNNLPQISGKFGGNVRMIDVAPRQFVNFHLDAADSPREVEIDCHVILRHLSVDIDMKTGVVTRNFEFEAETFPTIAVKGLAPTIPPTPSPSPPPPVVVPGNQTVPNDFTYEAQADGIYGTINFSSASPDWVQIMKGLTGAPTRFVLDYFDPKNVAYTSASAAGTSASAGLWGSQNLASYADATSILTADDFATETGMTLDVIQDVQGTIAQQGVYYWLAIAHDGSSNYYVYLGHTLDGATSWAWTQVGLTSGPNDVHGLAVSLYNAGTVLVACGGRVYTSTDFGVNFTYSDKLWGVGPANIILPYAGNSSDLTVIASGQGPGSGPAPTFLNPDFLSDLSHWTFNINWGNPTWVWIAPSSTRYDWGTTYIGPPLIPGLMQHENFVLPPGDYQVDVEVVTGAGSLIHQPRINNVGHTLGFGHDFAHYGSPPNTTFIDSFSFTLVATDTFYAIDGLDVFAGDYAYLNYFHITQTGGGGGTPIMLKSADGAATFPTDITPPQGAPIGFQGLACTPKNSNHLAALTPDGKIIVSTDQGGTWNTKQTGLSNAVGLTRWPYNETFGFLLSDGKVWFTNDDFTTLIDKTGDLVVTGQRSISPLWTQS